MKITLHVDDDLLSRVMRATGAGTKTKAIDLALREMDRRAMLVNMASEGLGLSGDELRDSVDPNYDLDAVRRLENPITYGRKPRSRG